VLSNDRDRAPQRRHDRRRGVQQFVRVAQGLGFKRRTGAPCRPPLCRPRLRYRGWMLASAHSASEQLGARVKRPLRESEFPEGGAQTRSVSGATARRRAAALAERGAHGERVVPHPAPTSFYIWAGTRCPWERSSRAWRRHADGDNEPRSASELWAVGQVEAPGDVRVALVVVPVVDDGRLPVQRALVHQIVRPVGDAAAADLMRRAHRDAAHRVQQLMEDGKVRVCSLSREPSGV
jgi:hypothetical protein